mmetsp:Transcript_28544/g.39826  ORF Transcript_28544/g.39826 Transcript_28544/m.39826 type:complete len:96 (+) Transcript_28544:71-358(+)
MAASPSESASKAYQRCIRKHNRTMQGWRYMGLALGISGALGFLMPATIPATRRLSILAGISASGMFVDYLLIQRLCIKETSPKLPPLPVRKPAKN